MSFEAYLDDHLIHVRFVKRQENRGIRRGIAKRPVYGAFPHELPKQLLSKFPVIFSYDTGGRLNGVEIFRAKSKR